MNLRDYGIIALLGARGKGKSLSGVYLAKLWSHEKKVFSNIWTSFSEKVKTSEIIQNIERFKDCCILIDEPQRFFDSRGWKNTANIDLGLFLNLIRKFNINLILCCQYMNLLDIRIRQQIDLIGYPKIHGISCVILFYDIDAIENGLKKIKGKMIFNGQEIFESYNTKEVAE